MSRQLSISYTQNRLLGFPIIITSEIDLVHLPLQKDAQPVPKKELKKYKISI